MKTIHIRTGNLQDAEAIISIAYHTWPITYSTIVSNEQIEFMLGTFYNLEAITEQLNNPTNLFFIAESDGVALGYAHVLPTDLPATYKLSKLYILPQGQGIGIGYQLLLHAEHYLLSQEVNVLILNVNRLNKAVNFYSKMNYEIIESVDIPLDKFWLNDYIMQKKLTPYSV
jgi:diamine N-acetyltransferase